MPIGSWSTLRDRGDATSGGPHVAWVTIQLAALSSHLPLAALIGPTSTTVGIRSVLSVSAIVTVVALMTYRLLARVSSGWNALAVTSILLVFFWHWSAMQGILGVPKWLVASLIFAALIKLVAPLAPNRRFRTVIFVASVTFVSVLALRVSLAVAFAPQPTVEPNSSTSIDGFEQHPDVVLVVLDGYGRDDTLSSTYGFDNDAFLSDLSSRGFDVGRESTANNSITHFSLASLLEMSQVADEHTVVSNSDLAWLARAISGSNQVVSTLKRAGYTYIHFETSSWVNDCGDPVDMCFPATLLDETAYALLEETPVGGLLFPSTHSPVTHTNLVRIQQIADWDVTSSSFPSGPNFVFLHLLVPHPPLFLDRVCRVAAYDESLSRDTIWDPERKLGNAEMKILRDAYVEQVECTNRTILELVDQLEEDSVVILTADHGPDSLGPLDDPRTWTDEQLMERFGIFSAIRLPSSCRNQSDSATDVVNTFRRVFSCLTGSQIPSAPEEHYVAGFSGAVFKVDSERLGR